MRKIFGLLTSLLILNGCAESMALLGPASSSFATSAIGGGKAVHSTASSILSYGIKQQTGLSPTEHALAFVKEHNPENKKERCVSFIESTNSETCAAVKESLQKTRKKIAKKSKVKFLNTGK
ncbi:MAG: hypothetical protein CBE33_05015 [Candidatus Pelagibacter sp. TMED273]|nr:MAG: hypothetical protein CBE33_05015 [Candidatus Pelagibacter sp. TMED273]|tara:strand:+ start:1342 stop:1707 length:366 start_codon:yes stop_codon:yes gene_type:complete